jgi:hypothetical protein
MENNEEELEATPTEIYLELDDAEIKIRAAIDKMKRQLGDVQFNKELTKQRIIKEYQEDGIVPDDGLIIKKVKPKVEVTDPSLLPDIFFKTEKTLNKAEVNKYVKENGLIDGVEMGKETLTVAIVAQKK